MHVCMTLHKKEVLRGFPSNVPPAPPDQLSVRNMAVLGILTPLKSLAPILLTVGLTKLPEVHTDSDIQCSVQKGHIYTSSVCHGTILLHFQQAFQPPNSKHTPLRSTLVGNCHRNTCKKIYFIGMHFIIMKYS